MKLLRETYKTWEGAHKRARFENGIAPSEFKSGYKAKLYRYRVVGQEGAYRVERYLPDNTAFDALKQISDDDYEHGAEHAQRVRDAAEGFDNE